jgi:aquaporin Z
MKRYLTELIGTFFFVLTICMTLSGQVAMAPLAIGCVLMAMVYMGAHVSGGHYNPAVSLAVMLRGKLSAIDFVPYILCQIAGAMGAAYLTFFLTGRTYAPAPSANVLPFTAILVEGIFTFALCLVVLNVTTSPRTEGNSFHGLAIGGMFMVCLVIAGPISGGAFNPAAAMGPITIQHWLGNGTLDHLGYYIVGPFLGGALAALVFAVQHATWKISLGLTDSQRDGRELEASSARKAA